MSDQPLCAREGCGKPRSDWVHVSHPFLAPPVVPPLSESGTRNLTREERAEFDAKHYDILPDIDAASHSAPEPPYLKCDECGATTTDLTLMGQIDICSCRGVLRLVSGASLLGMEIRADQRVPPGKVRIEQDGKHVATFGLPAQTPPAPTANYVHVVESSFSPYPFHESERGIIVEWAEKMRKAGELSSTVGQQALLVLRYEATLESLRTQLATERAAHEALQRLVANVFTAWDFRDSRRWSPAAWREAHAADMAVRDAIESLRASLPSSSTVSNQ